MERCTIFIIVIVLILVVVVAHVFACERLAGEYTLLPAGRTLHTHLAALGDHGDGASTVDQGHSHQVRGFVVEPAGADVHVHDIMQYIVDGSR